MSGILEKVNVPDDMRDLSYQEMEQLASDVRETIIDTVSKTGGHLAASLGVVDLTVALLKIFNPPSDKIIWDVGHQSYAYKILTGRKDRFSTLRQMDGISGFTKMSESEYDAFGAGHAGTALSAGLGMACARDMRNGDDHVIVITGDASASNGITLEALNNLSHSAKRMIVILNDNEMSISKNVGAMSGYLGNLLANPRYNRWKRSVESAAKIVHLGWLRSIYYRLEESIKSLFLHSVIFEEFGLRYVGPIDGHNMHAVMDALTVAKEYDKPILLHVATKKGKGYEFAETHPEKWHGTVGFDIKTGVSPKAKGTKSYSAVFGEVAGALASENKDIVAITAAMTAGTGLESFADKYPERLIDVGMSEEHAVVFAAGLAAEGFQPIVAIYSTFIQRSIDCIIHDVCLQDLPVIICLDRAGVVGDDGPTHHGVFDIALLSPVPGLTIMQPRDESQMAHMLHTAVKMKKPVVVRYPRGCGTGAAVPETFKAIPIGKAEIVRKPQVSSFKSQVSIWAIGDMVQVAEKAAEILENDGIAVTVVDARFIKPLDADMLRDTSKDASAVVTIENGVLAGGFGSKVEEQLVTDGYREKILKFGWPDEFIPHGATEKLMEKYGLTAEAIANRLKSL